MKRPTYPQNWPLYNLAQTREKLLFLRLLSDAVDSMGIPNHWKGNGRPVLSYGDMLKCCAIKVFVGASSRRAMSDIALAHAKGYIRSMPHFNSISNYLRDRRLEKYIHALYQLVAEPLAKFELQCAVDATGISTTTYSHWYDWRLGEKRRFRNYRKLHIMTGTVTNVIASAVVTDPHITDGARLPALLKMSQFQPREISADSAYTSRANCSAVEEAGAVPFLKPKKNATPKALGSPAWRRMISLWNTNQALFRGHYHRRSNVESTFSMIKRKFNSHILSRKKSSQINEILLKVVCHNISVLVHSMFELNIEVEF